MNGLDIFAHSVRQVFGNLGAALKISAILYVVHFGVIYWLTSIMPGFAVGSFDASTAANIPWGPFLITYIVLLITGLWIAVAWHRYVLLNEEPVSVIPSFRGDRMLAYFGYSLLIGLIMVPILLILSLVIGVLLGPLLFSSGEPGVFAILLLSLLVTVPIIVIGYRLSVVLPAAALEETLGIGGAWERTKGTTGTIIVLAIVSAICFTVIGLPAAYLFSPTSLIGAIWSFVTQWIVLMVGISILTTLYGHYVEERPLV